jgi:hypothetical protein
MNKLLIYLFTSALHVSGFRLAHLQRQVYNFGSGSSLLGMVLAPERWHNTQETWTTAEYIECRKNDSATKIYRKFVTLFSVR